ncbi:MAG TPA: alpha/beta hydrolase [Herpetosiphonaceae bacterium]
MADWQAGDVETNGIRLHYTRTGGNLPSLVLAHGVTDDGLCWTPVAEALQAEYDVIMVDARGHGRSDAPETGYDAATQAADLHGLITALGLHKPFVLGHSMGAATTLVLAGVYPNVPGAILLEDPPGWWALQDPLFTEEDQASGTRASAVIHGRNPDDERLVGMQAWFADLKRKTREQLIAEQRAATPDWSEGELGPWADSKLRVSPHVMSVLNPDTPRALDWPAICRRITCPALLITADPARGAVLTEEGTAALQGLVPQLQVVQIPEAGHNIRRERFNRFIEVVRDFLRTSATAAS